MTWAAGRPADAEAPSSEKPKEPPELESPRHRVTSSSSSAITAHWSSPLRCHLPVMSRFNAISRSPSRLLCTSEVAKTGKGHTFPIWVIVALRASVTRQLCIYHSGTHTHARDGEAPSPLPRAALRTIVGRARSLSLSFDAARKKGDTARPAALRLTPHTRTPLLPRKEFGSADRGRDYGWTPQVQRRHESQRGTHASTNNNNNFLTWPVDTPQLIERACGATCARHRSFTSSPWSPTIPRYRPIAVQGVAQERILTIDAAGVPQFPDPRVRCRGECIALKLVDRSLHPRLTKSTDWI